MFAGLPAIVELLFSFQIWRKYTWGGNFLPKENFPSGSPGRRAVGVVMRTKRRGWEAFLAFLCLDDRRSQQKGVQRTAVVGGFPLRFRVLTWGRTWRNGSCGPCTWFLLRSQILHVTACAGALLCSFQDDRMVSELEEIPALKVECECSVKCCISVFGQTAFANYVVIFNLPEDAFNFRKMFYYILFIVL